MSENKLLDILEKDQKEDAKNVLELLKIAKNVAESVLEDVSFTDIISVYSLIKTEKLTRLTEQYIKMGKSSPVEASGFGSPRGGFGNLQ